jgi:hypothetical protein
MVAGSFRPSHDPRAARHRLLRPLARPRRPRARASRSTPRRSRRPRARGVPRAASARTGAHRRSRGAGVAVHDRVADREQSPTRAPAHGRPPAARATPRARADARRAVRAGRDRRDVRELSGRAPGRHAHAVRAHRDRRRDCTRSRAVDRREPRHGLREAPPHASAVGLEARDPRDRARAARARGPRLAVRHSGRVGHAGRRA